MNYPHSLDDSNSLFQVKDLGRSALFSEIDATQLEVMIENPTNFPEGRHIVVADSEMMIVSHRVDNVLHIEKRGAFDTFPDNHSRASKIGVVFASAHYETLRDTAIEMQKELWTYRKPVIDIIDDPQTIIPVENDSYLVGTNPINEFVGKTNNIAIWNGIEWTFIAPQVGFENYVANKGKYEFNGSNWILNKDIEISNVNNLQDELDKKVDKVLGKSLVEDTKVTSYDNHLANKDNPHNVTAEQVGAYTKAEVDGIIDNIPETDLSGYYNKTEVDSLISAIPETDLTNYYNKTEVDSLIPDISTKQDTLVSATNIKTINGESILGSGDLVISGGGASPLNKPVITSPINGATNFNGSITSTYSTSNSYKGEQDWVKWEASTDANFTNIIYNYEGSSNLTSWVPNMGLDLTTVYVRTKQGSDNHLSSWSDTISFTTPDIYIENPTLTVAGAPSSIGDKPVLTTSAFSVFNGTDTHISTDWIIEQSGTVIWSSMNNTTNKVSITVPAGYLVESTEYTFKVRHNSATYGSSSYVTVTGTTKAQFFDYDAGIGLELEGGYYVGKIQRADGVYALIVAPKALGQSKLAWKNANTTSGACKSLNNGAINTAHMVASGSATVYPAAHYCNNLIINGYSDWYLPARDELEIAYRNFKPITYSQSTKTRSKSSYVYTDINDGASNNVGMNSHSIPASGAYTTSNPAQTSLALFKQGGAESFYIDDWSEYCASTEYSSTYAWRQYFSSNSTSSDHVGNQIYGSMNQAMLVRAFRAVKIS